MDRFFKLGSFLKSLYNKVEERKTGNSLWKVILLYSSEDKPSEKDRAAFGPEIRRSICRELTDSGLLAITGLDPVDSMEVIQELNCPQYSELFNQIFSVDANNAQPGSYKYVNAYVQEYIFGIDVDTPDPKEYVFVCLMKHTAAGNIIPFFVSKEYDVGPGGQFYKPGRFVFYSPLYLFTGTSSNSVMLAEESTIAYTQEYFNVELYFLQIRKYVQLAESDHIDPVCKLISDDDEDPSNQHYRLCVAVSTSYYFWNLLWYPSRMASACKMKEISFRTPEARERAAGESYYEKMSLCFDDAGEDDESDDEERHEFYISRAYQSNHVLVYEFDPSDKKIYLVSLNSNISVVDELNSFDFVED